MKDIIIIILALSTGFLAGYHKSLADQVTEVHENLESEIYLKELAQKTANYWYEISKQLSAQIEQQQPSINTIY
tara:strand:- start:305 stop:526 length:222 start_codon:yes stop_codon:yes gene_type:complete